MTIEDILALSPVMPVVTIADAAHAVPMARALLAGGLKTIEITLRTPAALAAVSAIARDVPDLVIGVGTVLTAHDLKAAAEAGAAFAISPGSTPELMDAARHGPIPYLPAIATAGELMAGLDRGYTAFKFFPAAAAGGVAALKAFGGPFPGVRFCPTGGISLATAPDYLALPNVLCVGGSWIAPEAAIEAGDTATIERLAREAAGLRRG
ncbi:bifunctional 4-hydroxy-2-oxoglutarate aldolase/2-dehydro-3-deoxy-phosphogluconate aldolase [Caulobacter sp. KR2-114]|uniref:bifunctional 4-hydroxy-2-oxoglutarate aldolase/2-dehydro-3-deoxy-phosphogluconate aldolase n=1 Tax=Caulobacter sp. KR2-114 TaxID=3400912 RepID=UPI003C0C1960